ncbi:MAG: plastocyanin/azurin family copper-binding protein [Halobacteriales archaeon]|nr:plastocyanin/azurin family copper-binding protein [Halobacteriales archaeon]
MADNTRVDELELSDTELIRLIKHHGVDRRTVMQVIGVGTLVSLGAGSATAKHDNPHPPHIDSHYGYPAPEDERLPGKLHPDHTVELHIDGAALTDQDQTTLPFHFEPMGVQIEAGDIIRFDVPTPEHTISAYHPGQGRQRRVPDDNPPFSSPLMNAGGFWLYEFDSPGLYDLFCAPHELFGMVMRIVVGDPSDPNYDGTFGSSGRPPVSRGELTALGITTWPFPTAHEVLNTPALAESNIVTNGPISVTDVESDL